MGKLTLILLMLLSIGIHKLNAQDTLVLQPGAETGKDTFIWYVINQSTRFGPTSTTNYGSVDQFLAHEWTWAGSSGTRRSLLDFDWPELAEGTVICEAKLSLYAFENSADGGHWPLSGPNDCLLQRVTSPWEENTVTWNTHPSFTTQNQVKLPASTAANQDYLDIDITTLVKDMYADPANSHGLMLSMEVQSHYRAMIFASSDHPDPNYRPKLEIVYFPEDPLDLGKDTSLCNGEDLMLDATLPNATYRWQDGSTQATYDVTTSGEYWVEVSTCGGVFRDTIQVTLGDLPVTLLGNDVILCEGERIVLDATWANATYLWQDSSTNATLEVSESGEYWVQVSTCAGVGYDTIQVTYTALPRIRLGSDTILCEGQSLLLDATWSDANYLWQDGSTNSTFEVNSAGEYWVEVSNCAGIFRDVIQVNYESPPQIPFEERDTLFCQVDSLVLDAMIPNAVTYLWQDGSTDATLTVNQTGEYWVDITTMNGCVYSYFTEIFEEDCIIRLLLPNAFTPNQDGKNDLFMPMEYEGIVTMQTKIFDRWGHEIFTTDNPLIEWDGSTNQGKLAPVDVYFWVVYYEDILNNKLSAKGSLHLLK